MEGQIKSTGIEDSNELIESESQEEGTDKARARMHTDSRVITTSDTGRQPCYPDGIYSIGANRPKALNA